ncbi:MAG: DUF349 domain-containing protein [Bacteroidia bacterium]
MSESTEENAPNEQVTEHSTETPTATEESTTEQESPAAKPEPVSDDAPVAEAESVTPDSEEVTSDASSETAESTAVESTDTAETPTESTTPEVVVEEGVAHVSAEESDEAPEEEDESLPEGEVSQALLSELEDLSKDSETSRSAKVSGYTVDELILAVYHYYQQEEVLPLNSKVRIIKRSFDELSASGSLDNITTNRFRTALAKFNKKRVEQQTAAEAVKAENSEKKKALLVNLKEIVEKGNPELIEDVRKIQEDWKEIGHVLRSDFETLIKEYRASLDQFYQSRSLHFQMLDYDRKKNLEKKEQLIKEAELLTPMEDDREKVDIWRNKMEQFHDLQKRWKAVGHVPREDMDRINGAYREVIDRFFEVRQQFMGVLDKLRDENGEKKQAILAEMETFRAFLSAKPKEWNEATNRLRAFQESWKQIGQAPQAINGELWSKYREICNDFFSRKSGFFKELDSKRSENLEKKRDLVEQAEKLGDSSDWEKAAKDLKRLQREWKQIGPVPERHSNKLWNRFREACDGFFESRRSHYNVVHENENENLEAKKLIIGEVGKIDVAALGSTQLVIEAVQKLQAKWKDIGRVPYKFKDSIWEEFRAAIDTLLDGMSEKRDTLRKLQMKAEITTIDNDDERTKAIRGKIARIRRKMQGSQEKVDQYSTNIQYISKGKSGDTLRAQIQKEIDKEVNVVADLKKQIKELNEMLKNPPKPAAAPEVAEAPVSEEKTPEADATVEEATTEAAVEESATEELVTEAAVEETATETPSETPAEEAVVEAKAEESPTEEAAPAEESAEEASPPAEEAAPEAEPSEDDKK